jgi:BlaI family penicillinase repressor
MDILFALGRAAGAEIRERLPRRPTYSTVRTILRVLERKGYVRHVEERLRYVYIPTIPREAARKSALERLLSTFFDGSAKQAVAAFLYPRVFPLSKEDLDDLARMVEQAKKETKWL